jgi:hypothetical protein
MIKLKAIANEAISKIIKIIFIPSCFEREFSLSHPWLFVNPF